MHHLHAHIRRLRRLQKRTLKDVSDRCGFTVSLLSKIESAKTVPPLATLARIAAALGVTTGELLDGTAGAGVVATTAQKLAAQPPTSTEKGYAFHGLAPGRGGKLMQPFLFIARRGAIRPGPLQHPGEEFIHVLSGRVRYRVGATAHTLGPGDSLYFDAEEAHDFEPLTAEVRYLGIFAERPAPVPAAAARPAKTKPRQSSPR